ncbi:MAG: hypothetical protein IJH36_09970 [Clostridia bacterium]|nr:hypothetical protein [Clostridia bacterium]MBQ3463423.1 hypothetical protein [Clostridia bacterium]MBQ6531049.1 hypothetical protein [Clostridia bacterium]
MSKNKRRKNTDKREIVVSDIFRDFGVSIPLLSWSGMTEGELIEMYNECARQLGEQTYEEKERS